METSTSLSDTTADADRVIITLLHQTPVWRKLQLMNDLNEMTRTLALSTLRRQQPTLSDAELNRQLADRLLGAELATRVYSANSPIHYG